jgi:hypothetical protein
MKRTGGAWKWPHHRARPQVATRLLFPDSTLSSDRDAYGAPPQP